jgi:hypothetical protein
METEVHSYNEDCPSSTPITINVVDAEGNSNVASGQDDVRYVIPEDAAYPVTVTASSDFANATAVISDIVPVTYAIGSGDGGKLPQA